MQAPGLTDLGIINNHGPVWKEQRSVSLGIMRKMGVGKNVLADVITEECQAYLNNIAKAEGKPQDIRLFTGQSICNVICSVIVGHRFEYDDSIFKRIVEIIYYVSSQVIRAEMMILNTWPILHYIPWDIFNVRRMNNEREEFGRLFVNRFKSLEGSSDENLTDSYIANYVQEQRRREERGQATSLDERNLYKNIEDLVAAGTDTTANTIVWFVLFMIQNPEIQEKIFAEISTTIGTERLPTMSDREKLNYVNASILETQRLGNVAHMGVPHMTSRDTTFKGFRIPKDTIVVGYLTSVMFDESVWGPDVDSFRPDRFFDQSGNLKHFEEHIPFGTGRRLCPGESLARMELFLYVTSLCQRFKFLPSVAGCPPQPEPVIGITRCPQPFEVRVVERSEL